MPVLPSGRRVEFSLDRFHALLSNMDGPQAKRIADALRAPDDLFAVLDAVHFSVEDGSPFFADYVASNWLPYAAEWSFADRHALEMWLASDLARRSRIEAIDYIRSLMIEGNTEIPPYPYIIPQGFNRQLAIAGTTVRQ